MNNSYRTFFTHNFKKTFNNKNIFNVHNSCTNSKRSLIMFSNKFYMTSLHTLFDNTQFLKNNFPQIITGQLDKAEVIAESDTALDVVPLNGKTIFNYFLFNKLGNFIIK
jgi:hypothetical protein